MKLRTLIAWTAVAAAVAGGGWWWTQQQAASERPQFRTALVERGDLTAAVTASGTLAATVQVQVSSQVSGQIREVLADFNSEVRKGEVIARLDPETFEYRVRQAEADVEASRAQVAVQQATVAARRADFARAQINLDEARRDLDRKADLVARNFISGAERDKAAALVRTVEQEVLSAEAQVRLAESQERNARSVVRQREAQLASSRVDLGRTVIRAPVDGIVIKRSIEPGQTVAVSLAAPEMFLIAQNLRDMQVEVSIDEAEVSRLRVGQKASFGVDAFPGRSFEGTVRQVRKAARNEQNVITYTAVVSADNESLRLLPGMTANVRIVTDVRQGVLRVPNAALRFRPPGWTEPPRRVDAGARAGAPANGVPAASPPSAPPAADAKASAAPDGAGRVPGAAGGGASGAGGALQAFRARIDRELEPTDAQRARLDAAFGAARERLAGLRDAPEGERAKLAERIRTDLRAAVGEVLDDAQRRKYAEILVELSERTVARGRVFVPGADGAPVALELRLGLSDGAFTEVIGTQGGAGLAEGDRVYVGVAAAAAAAGSAGRTPTPAAGRLRL